MILLLLACAASPPATSSDLEQRFRELHARIYQVYALPPDRDAVWEHLSESFSGEALTDEYIEHYTALVQMEEAGSSVEILSVDYADVLAIAQDGGSARVEAEWTVRGAVHHTRHTHERINQYHALYTLSPTPDGLRITATRMKNLRRLQPERPAESSEQKSIGELLKGP